ncbi:MAG: (2Fe-2S)-binding protein [Planctomycetota bacterium]
MRSPSLSDPDPDPPMEDDSGAEGPRVCFCRHVHEATLLRAIRAGHRTLAALIEATGAGTGCGTCRFDLLALIERCAPGGPRP